MASWNGSALQPSRPAPPVPGGGVGGRPPLNNAHSSSSSSFHHLSSSPSPSPSPSAGLSRSINSLSIGSPSVASHYSSGYTQHGGSSGSVGSNAMLSSSVGGTWIREGHVSIKEDGIRSMFFSKRYAILRENALSFHKSKEVR